MKIIPTVGRVVWYWPKGDEYGQPLAAIVTHVCGDECVNLAVFTASGESLPKTSVMLYQGDGKRPTWPFAEWMPYQIGQAKKAFLTTDSFGV